MSSPIYPPTSSPIYSPIYLPKYSPTSPGGPRYMNFQGTPIDKRKIYKVELRPSKYMTQFIQCVSIDEFIKVIKDMKDKIGDPKYQNNEIFLLYYGLDELIDIYENGLSGIYGRRYTGRSKVEVINSLKKYLGLEILSKMPAAFYFFYTHLPDSFTNICKPTPTTYGFRPNKGGRKYTRVYKKHGKDKKNKTKRRR